MDISKITPLIDQRRVQKFEQYVLELQTGIDKKHIWNVDYNDAKFLISRSAEEAMDASSSAFNDFSRSARQQWNTADPRWLAVYHPNFMNTPGAYKKLQKYTGKWADLDTFLAVLKQIAEIAELFKAVKPFIVKGRKPSENPIEVDYTNTGICPVCSSRQKLSITSTMVAHGYTVRRNWGGRNGMCFGHGFTAWELSPDGAIAYVNLLEKQLENTKKYLTALQSSEYTELSETVSIRKEFGRYEDERRTHLKGTDPYEKLRQKYIFAAEQDIDYITSDIETYKERIANWKAQPLKYGGAETQERWKAKLLKN